MEIIQDIIIIKDNLGIKILIRIKSTEEFSFKINRLSIDWEMLNQL